MFLILKNKFINVYLPTILENTLKIISHESEVEKLTYKIFDYYLELENLFTTPISLFATNTLEGTKLGYCDYVALYRRRVPRHVRESL